MRCDMKKLLTIILTLSISLILSSCNSDPEEEPFEHVVPRESGVNLNGLGYAEYLSLNNPVVTITVTDIGEIRLQLFPELAPISVDNFIAYIQEGAYDDNEFHRVVTNFMIQGGRLEDPVCSIPGEMTSNDGYENELGHYRGVLSMARVGDDYNSGSSQFFIVQRDTGQLDGEYATFGGVVAGFNVLDYIASLQAQTGEVPIVRIEIQSITIDLKSYDPGERICFEE